jgi:hypothetical protein
MSAFPESGHSDHGILGKLRGRFRLRLCDNESIFLIDWTAHHNDFCWRLGDAMQFHMRAHPYALNGTFLADTSETLSSALQFPVVKNKTSIQEK